MSNKLLLQILFVSALIGRQIDAASTFSITLTNLSSKPVYVKNPSGSIKSVIFDGKSKVIPKTNVLNIYTDAQYSNLGGTLTYTTGNQILVTGTFSDNALKMQNQMMSMPGQPQDIKFPISNGQFVITLYGAKLDVHPGAPIYNGNVPQTVWIGKVGSTSLYPIAKNSSITVAIPECYMIYPTNTNPGNGTAIYLQYSGSLGSGSNFVAGVVNASNGCAASMVNPNSPQIPFTGSPYIYIDTKRPLGTTTMYTDATQTKAFTVSSK